MRFEPFEEDVARDLEQAVRHKEDGQCDIVPASIVVSILLKYERLGGNLLIAN